MAKKPTATPRKGDSTAKAVSTSGPKSAASKRPALSQAVEVRTAKPKPAKTKSVNLKLPVSPSPGMASAKLGTRIKTQDSPKDNPNDNTTKFAAPSVLDYQEQRARIARRAYELYEERCPPDGEVQDWIRAEREIMQKP